MRPYNFHCILILVCFVVKPYNSFFAATSLGVNSIVLEKIDKTEEICELSNGTLTIHATGGSADLFYSIDGGSTYQTSNYFDGLKSDDYLIIISDGNGCSKPFSTQIVSASTPKVDLFYECVNGLNAVDIELIPFSTGIQPFDYNWEAPNGAVFSSKNLTKVDPGDYYVTITDRLGCSIDTFISIPICCQLSITCESDTVFYNCLSDIPEIDDMLGLPTQVNNDNELFLNSLNFEISESCNSVYAFVTDENDETSSCKDGALVITRKYEIHDGVSSKTCQQVFVVDNFKGIEILQEAQDITISCGEDILALYDIWLADLGGAIFESCSENFSVTTNPQNFEVTNICEGSEVTFSIEDECGNLATTKASFNVVDLTPPDITCPESISLSFEEFDSNNLPTDWLNTLPPGFIHIMISCNCGR